MRVTSRPLFFLVLTKTTQKQNSLPTTDDDVRESVKAPDVRAVTSWCARWRSEVSDDFQSFPCKMKVIVVDSKTRVVDYCSLIHQLLTMQVALVD